LTSACGWRSSRATLINTFSFHWRASEGGGTGGWASDVRGVPLPNAWIRLRRTGNTFRAYTSTDGENWTQRGETEFDLPETILVGIAVTTAGGSSSPTRAVVSEYGDYTPGFVRRPMSQTVLQGSDLRLISEARGAGELHYQWHFNGAPLPGENTPTLFRPAVTPSAAGDYYVVATNYLGSVTSRVARVAVDTSNPMAGWEADVAPRPEGNGAVTVADWTQAGRFAAGLDAPSNASEFTRADCAPRSSLGDNAVTLSDWVQAGRYAAGLDPLTAAGGPNGIAPTAAPSLTGMPRPVEIEAIEFGGRRMAVALVLRGIGDENAVGCSLRFDAGRLRFVGAELGSGGASLLLNDTAAAEGRLGLIVGAPIGRALPSGRAELARVEFEALEPGAKELALCDEPVAREAATVAAQPAPIADPGLTRIEPPAAGVWWLPRQAGVEGWALQGTPGGRYQIEESADLRTWTPVGVFQADARGVVLLDIRPRESRGSRFYRARPVE